MLRKAWESLVHRRCQNKTPLDLHLPGLGARHGFAATQSRLRQPARLFTPNQVLLSCHPPTDLHRLQLAFSQIGTLLLRLRMPSLPLEVQG